MRLSFALLSLALLPLSTGWAQDSAAVLHADSLRGSITPERAWWDVAFYDLHVRVNPADSTIAGVNRISYRVLKPDTAIQIDLQEPLVVDSFVQDGQRLEARRDGNAFIVRLATAQVPGQVRMLSVYYGGRPRVAKRAPWDGGFVWATDSLGHTWIATACQGLGASVWWPNKDTQADEPDSQRIAITVPDSIKDVSNGRLRSVTPNGDGTTTYEWFVTEPINNYDVAVNAGDYAHYSDTYHGLGGDLSLNFWPLAYHLEAARRQFPQVKSMLACFENWFGPYPWYADGYQLVETPHLGMEHQSGIAYGNHFLDGYLGRDLSGTGQGLDWDFIIVHESAHEWFGNSLTSADLADMWVHESFASYAEGLYVECLRGKEAGATYLMGTRKLVRNNAPIIPAYGLNREGSGDMYPKGANMLHTIRQVINDDDRWRGILRGLNATYRHEIVTGRQVEDYISRQAGIDLSRVFQQYLTTTWIPTLEYRIDGPRLWYRWTETVPGFDLPVRVTLADSGYSVIRPAASWQAAPLTLRDPSTFRVDPNYYVIVKPVGSDSTASASRAAP
ncbi:MAG TPA: M1 family metallopeptidase [Gemmatimonadales bacterium]|nr:M1 family metallopeptidase [Gemmatimonadales bacterium]